MKTKKSFTLNIFEWAVLIALASTTFLFGYTYIGPVFGASVVANVLGALYCLLLLDVGFLVWRGKRLQNDLTTEQRHIALALTVMSFIGSLATTITELVLGTSLLDISTQAAYGVGFVTFILLLVALAAHAAGLYAYSYFSLPSKIAEKTSSAAADMFDAALDEVNALISQDRDAVIASLMGDYRRDILEQLGFTLDLRRIGHRETIIPGEATAVPSTTGFKLHADGVPLQTRYTTYEEAREAAKELIMNDRLARRVVMFDPHEEVVAAFTAADFLQRQPPQPQPNGHGRNRPL